MAQPASSSGAETSFLQTLERLSSKPGVVAALVLDRSSNALLHTTGSFAWWNARTSTQSPPPTSTTNPAGDAPSDSGQHFASTIARYVETTGELVKHMEPEDPLSLLRVRTKKHEILIVPDAKFIFVTVHEISG